MNASPACPKCGNRQTSVIDCRGNDQGVRRRRECAEGHRFTTQEMTRGQLVIEMEKAFGKVMAVLKKEHERIVGLARNK